MNTKKILTCIIASAIVCGNLAACGDKDKKKKSSSESSTSKVAEESSAVEPTTEDPYVKIEDNNIDIIAQEDEMEAMQSTTKDENAPEFENAVEANSGDAFLALDCDEWWVQYWGSKEDPLCYGAGIETIDGNGQYTVSLTTDTEGFRYAMTNNTEEQFTPENIGLAAVIIKDGASVCPDAVITIDSITVNGEAVELTKKNYTNTESGSIRANIYNEWVSEDSIPHDAKTAEGPLYENNMKTEINDGSYGAVIADKEKFANWNNITVTFTVSGLDHDKPGTYYEEPYYEEPVYDQQWW